jgi:hypothetical protein
MWANKAEVSKVNYSSKANNCNVLEWYRDECAKGGKVAIGCSNINYESSNAGSIGARRMPDSYGCCMDAEIASRIGWTNNFAVCNGNIIVNGG